jgi:orotidine-5'-phosphate decarboxylase
MASFTEKLTQAQSDSRSIVCVGLDPDPNRFPDHLRAVEPSEAVVRFCRDIIDATADVCCAYKPNLAFFEALGNTGMAALEAVVRHVPGDRLVIADGKRGDIGNTAAMYARSIFDYLGCDACTVSPYMGSDAVGPFLEREGTAAFVLVRTSNPGATELQTALIDGTPLYLRVAEMCRRWAEDYIGQVGFVIGATDVSSMGVVRDRFPSVPFLIPGIGAQGGDPREVVRAARPDSSPVVVNASRAILYAGSGADFADRAKEAASELRDLLTP